MLVTDNYIIVDRSVAPEVFVKVVEAKNLLASGRCKTTSEALASAKISRSAFYKYKNSVFTYSGMTGEKIVTLFFTLDDVAGILSDILSTLATHGANVLTINQNIPSNGIANITISIRTDNMTDSIEELVARLKKTVGVNRLDILSM